MSIYLLCYLMYKIRVKLHFCYLGHKKKTKICHDMSKRELSNFKDSCVVAPDEKE